MTPYVSCLQCRRAFDRRMMRCPNCLREDRSMALVVPFSTWANSESLQCRTCGRLRGFEWDVCPWCARRAAHSRSIRQRVLITTHRLVTTTDPVVRDILQIRLNRQLIAARNLHYETPYPRCLPPNGTIAALREYGCHARLQGVADSKPGWIDSQRVSPGGFSALLGLERWHVGTEGS